MGSLAAIRSGLATRLATIGGLNTYPKAPGTVTTPCAFPLPGTIEFDDAMARGSDLLVFEVRLLIGRSTDTLAQEQLDPYLSGSGDQSVKAAIEGDGTLAGVADWTRVVSVTAYGDIEHAGVSYIGAKFRIEVDVDGA